MLLRCCLIHITNIVLLNILYLVYLCSCLGLGLFILYLCDILFIFSLIFIIINHIILSKETHLFCYIFYNISFYFWMIKLMNKVKNFLIAKFSLKVLLSSLANFNLVLFKKVLLIKKVCISPDSDTFLFVCCNLSF